MPVLQEQKLVIILTGLGVLTTQKSTAESLPREALWVHNGKYSDNTEWLRGIPESSWLLA